MAEFDLEAAVSEYGRQLFCRAYAMLCDWHEAEDVVQDVFVRAWMSRREFDGRSTGMWLRKIADNRCVDILRRRKRLSLEALPEDAAAAGDIADGGCSPATIRALRALSDEDRAIVLWRVMDGLSHAEIARRLKLSDAAVRKRFERAKKRLAEALSGNESEVL